MQTLATDQVVVDPTRPTNTRQGPRVIDIPEFPTTLGWLWGEYEDTSEFDERASIRHAFLKRALRRLDHESVPRNRQLVAFHETRLEDGETRISHLCREDQNLYPEIASSVRLLPDHDPRVVAWPDGREDVRTMGWCETNAAEMTVARNGWLYWAVCRMNEEGIPEAQQRVSFRETPGKSPGSIDLSCMYWSVPA
jgi:hypothetical protein